MKAKTSVIVILTTFFVLMLCGAASAGTPLQENQTGTVSGDLYVNTTDGWPSSTQGATNIITQANTLPTYTSIDSAWVYVNVYSGSGSNNWPVRTTVQLDGNGDGDYDDTGETLGVEDMNIPGSPDGTVYWLNDHCMRVYSDYQVWYNVTGLVTSNNPTLYVKTETIGGDGYDGRIKLLTLTVAYNDGDTDQVDYWVLNGQDWINSGSSSSTFNTSSFNGQVSSATLNTVALSSIDGTYTLNTSSLTGNLTETGSYYKEHQWDVTSNINKGTNTNLTYTNVGASLKLNLATLTIREATTTPTPIADFTATPTTGTTPLTVNFTNTSTDANTYQWDFDNNGTTDSTDTNPTWIYSTAGTYTIKLTATGPGGTDEETKTDYITVNPAVIAPVADFTATPTTGTAPLTVNFTDTSTNTPTSWAWYFGDENYTGSWTQMTASANWTARRVFASVVLPDSSIVMMGGYTTNYVNDVWRSTDEGATWTQMTANASWSGRFGLSAVVLPDGSIVMMGGRSGSTYKNDVWRSTDEGATWTQMTANAGWSARYMSSSIVLPDGSIILMGGGNASSTFSDVWQSTDMGVTWTQVTANPGWSARRSPASLILPDGSIVLMGGTTYAAGPLNDVWRSTDKGATWTQMTANAGWSARYLSSSVALPDGSIILTGGWNDSTTFSDVWRSTDKGATWTLATSSPGWSTRQSLTSVILPNGSIILMGGSNSSDVNKNDVWRLQTAGSLAQNPSHTYTTPGTYSVSLNAWNDSGSNSTTKSDYIIITGEPLADFTATPTNGSAPLQVTFTNTSTDTTSYVWDFDNNGTTDSTDTNPTYTYNTVGTYTVKLTANGPGGSDDEIKTDYITVNTPTTPVADFTATPTNGSAPLQVTFTNTSTDATSYVWDFDNNGTTDSTDTNPTWIYSTAGTYTVKLTANGPLGTDEEIKTDYITVNNLNIDLTITGLVNCVPASAIFAYEPNTITVSTIKNQGPDTATNIVVKLYASDVDGGNTAVTETTIASLGPGATVSLTGATALTDPTIRTSEGTVTYTAKVDPDNLIIETDETNNNKNSTAKPLRYNGYKGKRYWTGGSDITTKSTYDLRGDIVYYTQPSSAYKGVGWTTRTETWTATDLPIPEGATVEKALLFFSYNWDQTAGGYPNLVTSFNGININLGTPYRDWSNFGTYADYEYGLYPAVDVTSLFVKNGDNTLLTTPGTGNTNALYPSTLAVIYSDPTMTRKVIYINEECDELGVSQSSYATTLEEATAYATFNNVDTTNVSIATLHSFAGSAGPGEGNLLWNGTTIVSLGWPQGNSSTASAQTANVTSYLTTNNEAGIQGTTSGGMDALQQILVVEYADAAPVADFTATPTTGTAPLQVTFTNTSTNAPTSWLWDFGDGDSTNATEQNPIHIYAAAGTYTVTLTATNAAGSDSEEKTEYITVNIPADVPVAAFSADRTTGTPSVVVRFTDESLNTPTGWSWDFGDGKTSIVQNPSHIYTTAGNFTVTLTTTNSAGSDTEIKIDYISMVIKTTPPVWTAKPAWNTPNTGNAATPAFADLDGDGDYDLLIGSAWTYVKGYENTGTSASPAWIAKPAWNPPGEMGLYVNPAFADLDGDGDHDLLIGADDGVTYGYENTGTSGSPVWTAKPAWNAPITSRSASPVLADLDSDGDYDLLIGANDGVTYGYENTGTSASPLWTAKPAWNTPSVGAFAIPALADLDGDGDYDLLIGAEAGVAYGYENTGTSASPLWTAKPAWNTPSVGAYTKPALADLDGDGDYDLLIGEDGGVSYGYENTGMLVVIADFSATPTSGTAPLQVTFTNTSTDATTYQWDFDNNGTTDSTDTNPVWTYNTPGTYTIKLTATGPGGTDDEIKTDYITVSGTPDLIASDLQMPSNPVIATAYPVSATVTNGGNGDATSFTVKLYDNNTQIAKTTLNSLASGASTPVSFSWTPSTTGAHVLAIIADTNNEIIESSEINNLVSVQVSVNSSTQPDLTVSNLQVPSTPAAGTTYPVTVSVTNNGTVDTTAFAVKLYDNNVQVAKINLTGLAAGASTDVTFNWLTYTTGAHNLSVIADANQQITEYNESNNQISQQATVNPSTQPDLTVTDLQLPSNPVAGNTYQITATVTNLGTVDAGAFAVKLYDNNTQLGKINITSLSAGTSTQVTFNWTPTTGTHNLAIKADANNHITEYNENNNQITQQITVS